MLFPINRATFLGAATTSLLFGGRSLQPLGTHHPAATNTRRRIHTLLDQDPTLAGPFLRLAFHDATTFDDSGGRRTGGPNASIRFEIKDRSANRGLGRPLAVLTELYQQQQLQEGQTSTDSEHLSLADTIALAGAVGVEHAGGPFIDIPVGCRPDAEEADPERLRVALQNQTPRSLVDTTLPSAALDSDELRLYFGRLGLDEEEFVALSGSHSLGRHVSLLGMPLECLKNLTRTCLEQAPVLLPFVTSAVDRFDNSYFQALLRWNNQNVTLGDVAFIPTDVSLVVDSGLRRHVERFARDEDAYFRVFARAYRKLVQPR